MGMNNIKAVIFDLDDTLYDRKAVQIEFARRLYRNLPHIFADKDIETIVSAYLETDDIAEAAYAAGSPWDSKKQLTCFLGLLGINDYHVNSVIELYGQDYKGIHLPVPEADTVLKELKKDFKIALITGGFSDGRQNEKLKAIGLADYFDYGVYGEEFGIEKPDPRIFQHAASVLAVSPSECLYIGDLYERDVAGAKNAGMIACWYNPEKVLPPEVPIFEADYTIENLTELLDIVSNPEEQLG